MFRCQLKHLSSLPFTYFTSRDIKLISKRSFRLIFFGNDYTATRFLNPLNKKINSVEISVSLVKKPLRRNHKDFHLCFLFLCGSIHKLFSFSRISLCFPFLSMVKSFSWCFRFFIKSLRFSFLSNDSVLWEIDFMFSEGGFFMRIRKKKRKSRLHDDSSFTFDSISLLTPNGSRAEGN